MVERERTRFTAEVTHALNSECPPVPAKLVVVRGPDEGKEVSLNGKVHVGRGPGNDLILTDELVSQNHLRVSTRQGHPVVTDVGSRNGTFLGEARVTEAELPIGTVLRLGPETRIAIQPRWYVREVGPSSETRFGQVLGASVAMREVFSVLERVAPSNIGVLVEGETGTGKEVIGRSLHECSPRAPAPYVVFDCGAVPRELAESELFGHKRGAFSGAVSDRDGAFGRAHRGTILLDEIGELPLELQPKLLRVLETGEVRRVGDDAMRKVDVRVIAATNRDLHAEARRGTFREDLLYRLDVVCVRVPPLRHRPEDIPGLVRHFLLEDLDPTDEIAGPNLERLMGYAWPGNVRELRNVLQRAVALAPRGEGGRVRFADLVFNLSQSAAPLTLGMNFPGVDVPVPFKEAKDELIANFEHAYVSALLARHDGNISQAAKAAGLSRKHLHDLAKRITGRGDDQLE